MIEINTTTEHKSSLKRRLLESIARISGRRSQPGAVESFEMFLNSFGGSCSSAGIRAIDKEALRRGETIKHPNLNDLMSASEPLRREFHDLTSTYREAWLDRQKLMDERRAEFIADIGDRVLLLAFRIITAIGIAAVILGTGYVANVFGIPLPLLHL